MDYVQQFITATLDFFEIMVGLIPKKGEVCVNSDWSLKDITSLINISGDAEGIAIITFPSDVAKIVSEKFVCGEIKEEEKLLDAIGEMINIIAGNAKSNLDNLKCKISLPYTFKEKVSIEKFKFEEIVCIPFTIDFIGEFSINIALKIPQHCNSI